MLFSSRLGLHGLALFFDKTGCVSTKDIGFKFAILIFANFVLSSTCAIFAVKTARP